MGKSRKDYDEHKEDHKQDRNRKQQQQYAFFDIEDIKTKKPPQKKRGK